MAINKVEANGRTLIDLTSDTVTADTLLSGRTAHLASGVPVTGTFEPVTGVKGNAEGAYRKGNVNLTPANIGAATSAQGTKADSAVQTIQIGGTAQTKTGGTVNLPAYPTKSSLGLGNVDNTSDANKPISTAAQAKFDSQQAQIDYNTNQGVKNLCKITAESQTINGVTFTVDKAAGTITANGTANQLTFFAFKLQITDGKYILSGCPPTGSISTYRIDIRNGTGGETFANAVDYGTGSGEMTLSGNKFLNIRIVSGYNCSNLVFKPMIRDASIEDDTFEPYSEPNYQLTQKVDKTLEQAGYNLFKITLFSNTVSNGITYTVNTATGIVTANGTVTSGSVSILSLYLESNVFGNLNLSGCANGGSSSTYDVLPFDVTTSVRPTNWAGTYAADSVFSEDDVTKVKYIQGHTNIIQIRIRSGVTVSNLQFKPMLTKPELAGMPFQPYAMSNMELTQKALIKEDDNAGGYVVDLDKDCKLQRNGNYIYLRNNSINIHADSSNINLQCGTTGSPLRGVSITSTAVRMYFGLNTLTVDEDGLWFNDTKIAE